MVLRVDWLRILGPILWDFIDLTMRFQQEEKEVQLKGLNPIESTLENEKSICKNYGNACKGLWLQLVVAGKSKDTSHLAHSNSRSYNSSTAHH